ncbi:MAG: erythromycin esterase family protein [Phycisphaerae bacterium]|nr:erythromycin esterase family protein [Phycisphaerae bacterium]
MSRLLHGLIVLTLLSFQAGCADEPTPDAIAWLKDNALVFDTAEAGRGYEDLMPLKELIGDARVVALGEGTHGTREFFQMKHRIVEFLAEEMGFTIFSIEANLPEAYRLNDYVLKGEGDPEELIGGMYFWTWNTEEVRDLVLWMRDFNKSGRGEMQFTGFDMQTPDVAMRIVTDFVQAMEPKYAKKVLATYKAAKQTDQSAGGAGFGIATGTFPVEAAVGKRIRYSGYIKTEGITREFAGLWWRVDGKSGVLDFDNMNDRGPKGTTPWKRYEIELDVPADAVNIDFGVIHPGDGTAWFDTLRVEIDGRPYESEDLFDFDFESGAVKGFFTAGEGYEVAVIQEQAQTGKHSLRIRFTGKQKEKKEEASPKETAEKAGEILKHLESARSEYLKKASVREVEWAIQNAHVVQQCYQGLAGDVSRDESMATNVHWILHQAPENTKIVLWAHNGHVRKDAQHIGWRPMGAHLAKKYGDELVVLGFACNEGRYTAIKQGEGLQANELQSAKPGSAEYYFHRTGMPRFILDLRKASKTNPASAWLTKKVAFRSLGWKAMEQQFQTIKLSEAFDAIIYIDQTTASRPLGRAE